LHTWEEPLALAILKTSKAVFSRRPDGSFHTRVQPDGMLTTNGSSGYFSIPSHTTYAVANDDEGGSSNNGCCDYLWTPVLDLTNAPSFVLGFQSFYNGDYGQMAYVEMSTDGGATWTPIYTCAPAASWNQVDVDLSAYSGASGLAAVQFAFHADDAGQYAYGWAIDDVLSHQADYPYRCYGVFLMVHTLLLPRTLHGLMSLYINWGSDLRSGVAGHYCSGWSDLCTKPSPALLYPPGDLTATENLRQLFWTGLILSVQATMLLADQPQVHPLRVLRLNTADGNSAYRQQQLDAMWDVLLTSDYFSW
jgi:hypothetical protein